MLPIIKDGAVVPTNDLGKGQKMAKETTRREILQGGLAMAGL